MPRKPRPNVPGSLHHVVLRGNNQQDVFTSSTSRQSFLDHLVDAVDRLDCRIHAFCLMSNHIHLAVQQGEVPLSRIVQFLSQRHAVETNRARGATGHLFQGRFSSFQVETDRYALELVRYIHLNPVRAGIVPTPEAWQWSSHRAYLGLASFSFLTTEWALAMLGETADVRVRFHEFVLAGLEDDEPGRPASETRARRVPIPPVLADPPSPPGASLVRPVVRGHEKGAFRPTAPLDRVVSAVLKETGLTEADLASPLKPRRSAHARTAIAWLALHQQCATLTEVASRVHRDVSTISAAVSSLEEGLRGDSSLRDWLSSLLDVVHRSPCAESTLAGPPPPVPDFTTSTA